MRRHQVTNFVFSSSSSVYGVRSDATPISEDDHLAPITPYGFAKLAVERILADCVAGDQALAVIVLRYFNVAGAHSSGCLGERTTGTQGHLVPALCKVGLGFQDRSTIFGGDWNTSDGTSLLGNS
uniref:NAD-dependent epimerase/dehydratase domain-containing protein n=1 Tax=Spongospora subterranea TaxID=70186 RepID=A0A0H5QW96_9EUKA|eukprot:CRZ06190.1 hypothetical protein [Spongospora subterranea]